MSKYDATDKMHTVSVVLTEEEAPELNIVFTVRTHINYYDFHPGYQVTQEIMLSNFHVSEGKAFATDSHNVFKDIFSTPEEALEMYNHLCLKAFSLSMSDDKISQLDVLGIKEGLCL